MQRALAGLLATWLLATWLPATAWAAGPGGAQALYLAGSFEQAYAQAAAVETAAAQTLAAQAAIAQGLYVASSGADALAWLRRADRAADRAVKLAPDDPAALLAAAQAKGEIARKAGGIGSINTPNEVGSLLKRAVGLDPTNADALVGLGMWNLQLTERGVGWLYGAHRDGAMAMVERGVSLAPTKVNLRVEYATALLNAGDASAARRQLQQALTLPTPTAVDRYEHERAVKLLNAMESGAG